MNKNYYWISLLAISTIAVMLLFGKTSLQITEPFDVGFDQFIDIGSGIMFVLLLGIGIVIGYIAFKKK